MGQAISNGNYNYVPVLTLMIAERKLSTITKFRRSVTLMNTIPMLNARICITNIHDSHAPLAVTCKLNSFITDIKQPKVFTQQWCCVRIW